MTNKSNNGFNTWQKSFEKETKKNFSDSKSETDEGIDIKPVSVSYTHLTLPTSR